MKREINLQNHRSDLIVNRKTMGSNGIDPGSFRDRTSRVFYHDNSVFRALDEKGLKEWAFLSATDFFRRCMSDGKIIYTDRVDKPQNIQLPSSANWLAFLRHSTIPFISYPYEWTFGMLKDAALMQIELLLSALNEDMILKDSSAFNFQWIGSKPVFIDIPSFVRLTKGEPWVGYRQFCQMFLYPLMLQSYRDVPFQPFLRGHIDGLEPEEFTNLMSLRDLFHPGVFLHGYLHAKAQKKYADTKNNLRTGLSKAGFNKELIEQNIKSLKKIIQGLTWKRSKSVWSHYADAHSYTDAEHEIKKSFVRDVVNSRAWNIVWDIGCNTGTFSRIGAEKAKYVVAMDADHLAVERFYQELKREDNNKILPLVFNLSDPSPSLGWRNLERKTLIERGTPDLILCLALIHHLVISANIPLSEFVSWLSSLGGSIVIEFVTREDPMVKKLLLNKEDNYSDYEIGYFEKCLSEMFSIKNCNRLKGGKRVLYFAEPK